MCSLNSKVSLCWLINAVRFLNEDGSCDWFNIIEFNRSISFIYKCICLNRIRNSLLGSDCFEFDDGDNIFSVSR